MSTLDVELIFMDGSTDEVELWQRALSVLQKIGIAESRYSIDGRRPVLAGRVAKALSSKRDDMYYIWGDAVRIRLGPAKGGADAFTAEFLTTVDGAAMDLWVGQLHPAGRLVYARAYDREYDRWQNQTRLEEFEREGRSTVGLKTCWDDDFQTYRVDTSANPGRATAGLGLIEAIGHIMWLPDGFWQATGARRAAVCAEFKCEQMGDLLKVTLSGRPFNDSNPATEPMRALLFPDET